MKKRVIAVVVAGATGCNLSGMGARGAVCLFESVRGACHTSRTRPPTKDTADILLNTSQVPPANNGRTFLNIRLVQPTSYSATCDRGLSKMGRRVWCRMPYY
ncbi:hypothetical protein Bbelb_021530 [Branchiostoma belcheri]|nr:hypothetical protein Bbelb_021530 [Branchiostoma belcheri]